MAGGLQLEDREVEDDLKIINKTLAQGPKNSATSPHPASGSGSSSSPSFARDARIEDGKLFYEKRWFRRGQTIYVEGKDGTSYGATISAIGSDAIWVRRVEDNSKVLKTFQCFFLLLFISCFYYSGLNISEPAKQGEVLSQTSCTVIL